MSSVVMNKCALTRKNFSNIFPIEGYKEQAAARSLSVILFIIFNESVQDCRDFGSGRIIIRIQRAFGSAFYQTASARILHSTDCILGNTVKIIV